MSFSPGPWDCWSPEQVPEPLLCPENMGSLSKTTPRRQAYGGHEERRTRGDTFLGTPLTEQGRPQLSNASGSNFGCLPLEKVNCRAVRAGQEGVCYTCMCTLRYQGANSADRYWFFCLMPPDPSSGNSPPGAEVDSPTPCGSKGMSPCHPTS